MILIFRIRKSRIKALTLALEEVKCFMSQYFDAKVVIGGPLSSEKGIIAVFLQEDEIGNSLINDMYKLGYIYQVDEMVEEINEYSSKSIIKWKKKKFSLKTIYTENLEETRNQAPDKRKFLLPTDDGNLRYVVGYRGDGTETGKRALPVEDCKFMINIAMQGNKQNNNQKILDPFSGAGGIAFFAVQFGLDMYSSDIDPKMQYGLKDFGSKHYVSDVRHLPFDNDFFDSVVTEIPFDSEVTLVVAEGLVEIKRVVKNNGKIILMVANHQASEIKNKLMNLKLKIELEQSLDRKGTEVFIFKIKNSKTQQNEDFLDAI